MVFNVTRLGILLQGRQKFGGYDEENCSCKGRLQRQQQAEAEAAATAATATKTRTTAQTSCCKLHRHDGKFQLLAVLVFPAAQHLEAEGKLQASCMQAAVKLRQAAAAAAAAGPQNNEAALGL